MNFKTAENSFIAHCRFEKKLSEKTILFYQIDLKQFDTFLINQSFKANIGTLGKELLRQYIQNISHFKPKTIKRKIATLKAFFTFLEFEDIITVNPFRKLRIKIKDPRKLPIIMNTNEVGKILQGAYKEMKNTKSESLDYLIVLRDIAVLELLFATGMRVSELCTLKKNSINLETGVVIIKGKGSKERIIQVCNPEALKSLKEYYDKHIDQLIDFEYFFINRLGKRLSEQSVRYLIKRYTNLASIPKKITPHTFRHTFATLLLEEDVDIKYIQHFLGHSSIATTQIYTHVNSAKQQQILSTKHPRNSFEFN